MHDKQNYFLCGVGGSGMSALAQVLLSRGHGVCGSDRGHDQGANADMFAALAAMGVRLFPQDGTGITSDVDALIVSSAVENTIPDVREAQLLGIPIQRRAELLAELFGAYGRRVAVGGTSGKSTVTAMIGHILSALGADPTMINGAAILGQASGGLGNVLSGRSDLCVIEADESDGTIALYQPSVSVLTNIGLDHRPTADIFPLFRQFVARADVGSVLNADCTESRRLLPEARSPITFGLHAPADLQASHVAATDGGVRFECLGTTMELPIPGHHNVANALAAAAATSHLGYDMGHALSALQNFRGIHRRLERVGKADDVTVVDDFAHNPDKIEASLQALRTHGGRLFCIFQPHGYSPLRLFGDELVSTFSQQLGERDVLVMTDVYYAGGTVTRDVTPAGLAARIQANGRTALFIPERGAITQFVSEEVAPGDCVVVMGARDPSLTTFAQGILKAIEVRKKGGDA